MREDLYEIAEFLIKNGADPKKLITFKGKMTLLHVAAKHGHEKMVELLLHNLVNIDAKYGQFHFTPLHEAARNNKFNIVKLLIEKHADVMATTIENRTAFDLAKDHKIKRFLHRKMAEIMLVNKKEFIGLEFDVKRDTNNLEALKIIRENILKQFSENTPHLL